MLSNHQLTTWIIAATLSIVLAFCPEALAQHDHMHDDAPIAEGESIGEIIFDAKCSTAICQNLSSAPCEVIPDSFNCVSGVILLN